MLRSAFWMLILSLVGSTFAGEKPTLEHLFPLGAQRGTTNEITFLGKFEPWPPSVWSSNPGLSFQLTTNKGKGQLVIAADAPVGPCLVRLYNDEGASDLRIFVVDDKPELLEVEPNNHFAKPQAITNAPITINGRLEKNGDVDSFSFNLRAGQWLDASLDCYTLLAKLDPVLRLVTTNGYQLTWNHDFASLDPRIIWQAPYDLRAVLQVFGFAYPADSDIRLSGGAAGGYRLHLSLSEKAPLALREPPTEQEPNDKTNQAPQLEIPVKIIASIDMSDDIDRFKISLKAAQTIEARVNAASIGSPLDAWLAIENAAGKELTRNDDAENSRDPRLEWKAPEDGSYFVVVGSTPHRGGPEYQYHLAVRTLAPDYQLATSTDSLVLSAGTTNTLKLNLKRVRGFTNELSATVKDLPTEVKVDPATTLPAKDGEISISLFAPTNAPASNNPFRLVVTDLQTKEERPLHFDLVSRTENNGVPGGYQKLQIESTDLLWLTVKPKIEPKAPEQK